MKPNYKDLGKVCVTPVGIWSRDKSYERIDMVTCSYNNYSYIAKKDVPIGIDITNEDYWMRIGSGAYRDNNFIVINDRDENGRLKVWSLAEVIKTIAFEDRHAGNIISFYSNLYADENNSGDWLVYQFNSDILDDWNNESAWTNILDKETTYYIINQYLDNNLLNRVNDVLTDDNVKFPIVSETNNGMLTHEQFTNINNKIKDNANKIKDNANTIIDINNNLAKEVTDRTNADTILQTNIDAGIIRAQTAEKTLTDNLAKEVTDRTNAINDIKSNYIPNSQKGANNGVATLGGDGRVPSSQLPSYVDDVLEFDQKNTAEGKTSFPATGEEGKIYISKNDNKTYRWSGTQYIEISQSLALGETEGTAYEGNKGKAIANKVNSLATVATSGSYNDLTNKPTIPTASNLRIYSRSDDGTDTDYSNPTTGGGTCINGTPVIEVGNLKLPIKGNGQISTSVCIEQNKKPYIQLTSNIQSATTTTTGLMSSNDKSKLDGLKNQVVLSQADYDALTTKDANTIYFITD